MRNVILVMKTMGLLDAEQKDQMHQQIWQSVWSVFDPIYPALKSQIFD